MRICIPTTGRDGLDGSVARIYNRVPIYTLYDSDTGDLKYIPGSVVYQRGLLALSRMLSRAKCKVLVVQDIDDYAATIFRRAGLKILKGAEGTVREILESALFRTHDEVGRDNQPEHAIAVSVMI